MVYVIFCAIIVLQGVGFLYTLWRFKEDKKDSKAFEDIQYSQRRPSIIKMKDGTELEYIGEEIPEELFRSIDNEYWIVEQR